MSRLIAPRERGLEFAEKTSCGGVGTSWTRLQTWTLSHVGRVVRSRCHQWSVGGVVVVFHFSIPMPLLVEQYVICSPIATLAHIDRPCFRIVSLNWCFAFLISFSLVVNKMENERTEKKKRKGKHGLKVALLSLLLASSLHSTILLSVLLPSSFPPPSVSSSFQALHHIPIPSYTRTPLPG